MYLVIRNLVASLMAYWRFSKIYIYIYNRVCSYILAYTNIP